ncbi:MAG: NRDE family protein [Flavobacteriia bacterium]|nr:NRDE family protein [Flavobacteriia bacterium]
MCTVSYLPLSPSDYILTSNRDEAVERPSALPINQYLIGERTVYFPKDPQAGGTWIATTGDNTTLCLLNGGFEPHLIPEGHTFRKSRGTVLLDFFHHENADAYINTYDFSNIEPFTLIVIETVNGSTELRELRWTGSQLTVTPMNASEPHIWSSVTLYSEGVRTQRQNWFQDWLNRRKTFTQNEILHFHRFAGEGNPMHDLIMQIGQR